MDALFHFGKRRQHSGESVQGRGVASRHGGEDALLCFSGEEKDDLAALTDLLRGGVDVTNAALLIALKELDLDLSLTEVKRTHHILVHVIVSADVLKGELSGAIWGRGDEDDDAFEGFGRRGEATLVEATDATDLVFDAVFEPEDVHLLRLALLSGGGDRVASGFR